MKRLNIHLVFLLTLLLWVSSLIAQKQYQNTILEIIPDKLEESKIVGNMRVNSITGVPIAVYQTNYLVRKNTPEIMALQYLNENSSLLKIRPDLSDLKFLKTIETPGGYHIHFTQMKGNYPVYNSRITVSIDHSNKVYFVMSGYKVQYGEKSKPNLEQVSVPEERALNLAKNYLGVSNNTAFEKVETIVYYNEGKFRLAQQVKIVPTEGLYGDWEVLIDAQTGEIFKAVDNCFYLQSKGDNQSVVDGTGYVFDPDPITHARTVYGTPGFVDNNDADSDSLTAHREFRTLQDITFEGGVYLLKGPWAEIRDWDAPYTGLHTSTTNEFHYTRSDDSFEAVNAYFHIDKTMRWINDSLGIFLTPYQYTGGVRFDPHAWNGTMGAGYLEGMGCIAFGDGGVDAAEDMMVIMHEIGHGIHDWITSGSMSHIEGLSEGCGDYWAASNNRSTGYWTPADSQYNWVLLWFGHNEFWSGHVSNYPAHYPEGLTGIGAIDGQMLSSSLMSIYDLIGRVPTDMNFIEALAMTNQSCSQPDAAIAFMIADELIYGGNHLAQIIPVFVDRGYINGPVTAFFTANVTGGQPPLTVEFSDLSISYPNSITSWEWDFNNDGIIDSYDQNPTWVFTDFGIYTVSLTVSDGTNTDTETKLDYISINGGLLVWEGEENGPNYSGTFIKDYLQSINYPVIYSTSINLPTSMAGFEAIFLSFGNFGTGAGTNTIFDDDNAARVLSYLQNGGNVYLEGGDALGWDQVSDTTLLNLFGLSGAVDGSSTNKPITHLEGYPNSLTDSMLFTSSSQPINKYIDIYEPNTNGQVAFSEATVGIVAVQCSGTTYNQKTFCFSYALGKLNNSNFPSTKENLLNKILEFFEVQPLQLPSAPILIAPLDSATIDSSSVCFVWEKSYPFVTKYWFEMDTTDQFTTSLIDSTITDTFYVFDNLETNSNYWWRVKAYNAVGWSDFSEVWRFSTSIVSVENEEISTEYSLEQNYPNPFNPATTIKYRIPEKSFVTLKVYDILGNEIATLINGEKAIGSYEINFVSTSLPSGVYIYRLQAGSFIETMKMVLMK